MKKPLSFSGPLFYSMLLFQRPQPPGKSERKVKLRKKMTPLDPGIVEVSFREELVHILSGRISGALRNLMSIKGRCAISDYLNKEKLNAPCL